MTQRFLTIAFLLLTVLVQSQELTGKELLDKAIAYHDPNGSWTNFKGTLNIKMEIPNSTDRLSTIFMDNKGDSFKLEVSKDENTYSYEFTGENCITTLNGSSEISETDIEKFRLTCERGNMFRNYYSYLYGLPMKLKDKGTIIHDKVERRFFKGKEFLVLKATYDQKVGDDIWYFYFDPESYAMEVYQFYHDESRNDGEYILLEDMETISGIKMPKIRNWYYNKDDKFLGSDILN